MNRIFPIARVRFIIISLTAAIHAVVILFVAFNVKTVERQAMPSAAVMRLVDIQENYRVQQPTAPVEIESGPTQTNTQEAIAEYMVETDTEPPPAVIGAWTGPPGRSASGGGNEINYLPQSRITKNPRFPEDQIRRAVVYPPIARRSNTEGEVILELFIDRIGNIRDIRILLENPAGRGFGEAAVRAFRGIKAEQPAEANGEAVAVRFRYKINFKLN